MATTERNRMFSSIRNTDKNHVTFQYGWSDNVVITGNNPAITGAFLPVTLDANGNLNVAIAGGISISGASLSSNVAVTGGGTFTPTSIIITGSQQVINAGYKAASVAIMSGYAYINGIGPYLAGASLSYGGYNGYLSTNSLVVGTTGSTGSPSSVYVLWET